MIPGVMITRHYFFKLLHDEEAHLTIHLIIDFLMMITFCGIILFGCKHVFCAFQQPMELKRLRKQVEGLRKETKTQLIPSSTPNTTEKMRGRIILITGPMFGEKSTRMLAEIRKRRIYCQKRNLKMIVIKWESDTRYGAHGIKTHSGGIEEDVIPVKNLSEVVERVKECHYVFINEGQFFPGMAYHVINWARAGKYVVVDALLAYATAQLWEELKILLPWSKIDQQCAICAICGEEAPLTYSMENPKENTTKIGGAEIYEPRCIHCYPWDEEAALLKLKNV